MTMLKKLALVLAVMLCMTTVLGAVAESADTLMATVNGVPVTQADVDNQIDRLNNYYSQQGYDVTIEANAAYIKDHAWDAAVELAVMQGKAKELGFDQISDEELEQLTAEVAAEWDELVNYISTYQGTDIASTLALLESIGYTQDALLQEALNYRWYDMVVATVVTDVNVTDTDVEAYYAELAAKDQSMYEGNIAMYEYYTQRMGYDSLYVPAGYRGIRHILLEVDEALMNTYTELAAQLEEQMEAVESGDATEAAEGTTPVTQADVDAAAEAILASVQSTVDEINQKLADGISFTDLIAEYNTDPGMTQEPYATTGYSVHIESIVWDPAFTKGAYTMTTVGEVSAPVISSFGVHIMEYTCDIPAGVKAMDEATANSIKAQLIENAEAEAFNAQMEIWMNEATITYTTAAAEYGVEVQ